MTWLRSLRVSLTAGVIFIIGITILGVSWTIGIVECIHLVRREHQFQLTPFMFAFLGMSGGGLIIQTGSLVLAARKLKEMSRGMPGGRRWYDTKETETPPKEDE